MLDKDLRENTHTPMHHIGASLAIFLSLYHQGFLMHMVCFRIMNLSGNVFYHLFYALTKFDRKDSSLYSVTSAGMPLAGFVTRVVPMVWLWKMTLTALFLPCCPVFWPIKIFIVVNAIIFDVYNILIVYRSAKGCVKHFIRKSKKQ